AEDGHHPLEGVEVRAATGAALPLAAFDPAQGRVEDLAAEAALGGGPRDHLAAHRAGPSVVVATVFDRFRADGVDRIRGRRLDALLGVTEIEVIADVLGAHHAALRPGDNEDRLAARALYPHAGVLLGGLELLAALGAVELDVHGRLAPGGWGLRFSGCFA